MRILILLLLLPSFTAHAQAPKWDSGYRSAYYLQKTSLHRLLPDSKKEIIFLGNSITDIGEWTEIWMNIRVKNRGISGDNTYGVLARLDEVLSSRPAKLFIMIGINDIAGNIPDSVIFSNYKKIIARIISESPGTRLVVQSILPTNDQFKNFQRHQGKDEQIRNINGLLQSYCSQLQIRFLNLYPEFLDAEGRLDKQYTNDGLHLTGPGYMKWKEILIREKLMK